MDSVHLIMAGNLLISTFLAYLALTVASPEIDVRIAGGDEAEPHQFPYQVAIFLQKSEIVEPLVDEFCSGSLISPSYVLTAARCLANTEKVTVAFGNSRLEVIETTQESTEFIIPDDYQNAIGKYEWDVALIKLSTPVELSDNIQVISLAEGDDEYAGDVAIVAGWGAQWAAQYTVEPVLRWIDSPIISYRECTTFDNRIYQSIVTRGVHICQSTHHKSACKGDAGAPLVIDGIQVALASVLPANCFRQHPVVYTRVAAYLDWIRENSDI